MKRLPNINPHPIRGRRRFFDDHRKGEFRDLVDGGASLEEAAEAMDVSLRTVQREMKLDEDFHHEVRLAQRSTPEPEKLLKGHARTHWRAAAWLLERTDPERFARRPGRSASPYQVDEALRMMIEAALAATPPEFRSRAYAHLKAASAQAFQWVFPGYGPWGARVMVEPPKTPLVAAEMSKAAAPSRALGAFSSDERSALPLCPPEPPGMTSRAGVTSISSSPAALLSPQEPDHSVAKNSAPRQNSNDNSLLPASCPLPPLQPPASRLQPPSTPPPAAAPPAPF
jgi:hypothetical protein